MGSGPVSAGEIIGQASVIDEDTLEIHRSRTRLWGIDAPESTQSCRGDDSLPLSLLRRDCERARWSGWCGIAWRLTGFDIRGASTARSSDRRRKQGAASGKAAMSSLAVPRMYERRQQTG